MRSTFFNRNQPINHIKSVAILTKYGISSHGIEFFDSCILNILCLCCHVSSGILPFLGICWFEMMKSANLGSTDLCNLPVFLDKK